MSAAALTVLIVLFFITTVVGVVTGSNSLITVPVMFQFGIDEKVAIGTNMFGLTFMAIGATIPFLRAGRIEAERQPGLGAERDGDGKDGGQRVESEHADEQQRPDQFVDGPGRDEHAACQQAQQPHHARGTSIPGGVAE